MKETNEKITEIVIRMDENSEIELTLDGHPIRLAAALIGGLAQGARTLYEKLPEASRRVLIEEIASVAFELDPKNREEDEK